MVTLYLISLCAQTSSHMSLDQSLTPNEMDFTLTVSDPGKGTSPPPLTCL